VKWFTLCWTLFSVAVDPLSAAKLLYKLPSDWGYRVAIVLGEVMQLTEKENQWYTNKELYEMMVDLSKGLEQTNAELAKTQVMIREYNGLRERVAECEKHYVEILGRTTGSKDMWGYIVGGIGLISLLASLIVNY